MKPLNPVSKLAFKEMIVLSILLFKRQELTKSVRDESVISRLLFSIDVRDVVIEKSNISKSHYYVILSKLKKLGIIRENGDLDKRIIPDIENNKFSLLISFQINEKR
jgi:hypothetical protein